MPYRQVFWENILPFYLSIGLSKEHVLDSDPKELEPYVKANDLKMERQNFQNWMQGIYFVNAIGACFSKESKYPEEPIRMTPLTEQEELEKVRKAKEDVIAFFSSLRGTDDKVGETSGGN